LLFRSARFRYSSDMQSSGDFSLLRRLALAFGEGLVFSVGMKLTEDAIRPKTAPIAAGAAPELAPLADRLSRIEQRLKAIDAPAAAAPSAMDTKVIQVIVGAVEKHLEAHALKVQKRIDDLQATVTKTAETAAAGRIEEEAAALREQVATMQREMLSSVAGIVASQVSAQVAQRTAALEASVQQTVEAAVAPLRNEVRDLRRQLSETDDTMAEFVSAISDTVRRTSETLPPPARADGEWRPAGRVDLKSLRRRLSNVEQPVAAAPPRRGPIPVRQFPVAS
jgi:chromosome segregation ATPase